jgi:hypothetical protein
MTFSSEVRLKFPKALAIKARQERRIPVQFYSFILKKYFSYIKIKICLNKTLIEWLLNIIPPKISQNIVSDLLTKLGKFIW